MVYRKYALLVCTSLGIIKVKTKFNREIKYFYYNIHCLFYFTPVHRCDRRYSERGLSEFYILHSELSKDNFICTLLFAGFFMTKESLNAVYKIVKPSMAKVLLIVTGSLTILLIEFTPNLEWLFRGSFGIKRFLTHDESYLMKILLHYLLSAWICLLVLIAVNSKKSILTKWGDYSLGIFLFHPVFVFILRKTEFMNEWSGDTQLVFYFALAFIIVSCLGSNLLRQSVGSSLPHIIQSKN